MVDGAYQLIAEQLKPGVKESQLVANVTKYLFDMGSEHVDNINAVSGERCSPHPHVFSDRIIRPGDQAFFDIIQTYVGYKTCYYRTFTVGIRDRRPARRLQAGPRVDRRVDRADAAGRRARTRSRASGRRPRSSASTNEMECFGLQFGHSVGLFLHERPIISRLNSLDHPVEIKEGMVIALETYCPAKDGYSAARIEEEVVVTAERPAGHHPLPVARSCSWRTRTDGDGRRRRPTRPETRLALYRTMLECRLFETRAQELFFEGLVRGTTHLGVGQEAVAAGFAAAMRDDDYTFATYRGHNHALSRGAPMGPLYAELFGRANGLMGGKGGSMHITDVEPPHDGLVRDRRRPPADRAGRGVVAPSTASPARSRSASSATGRRTSARSTRR